MTSTALIRPADAIAWDLRGAWASGHRVSVTLDRCDMLRVEGTVSAVSATGATARIAGRCFPLERVLAVHKPSRLGDSTVRGGPWSGARPAVLYVHPEQLHLAGGARPAALDEARL